VIYIQRQCYRSRQKKVKEKGRYKVKETSSNETCRDKVKEKRLGDRQRQS
jgi:hypothetical protein